jgi:hypothetical protein
MTDNIDLFAGSVGQQFIVAADEIGGVKYQRVKLSLSPDGQAPNDIHALSMNSDGMAANAIGMIAGSFGYIREADGSWARAKGRTAIEGSSSEVGVPGVSSFMRDTSGFHRTLRPGDADNFPGSYALSQVPMLFDEVAINHQRMRGNQYTVDLASASRTVSTAGPLHNNYNHRGVVAFCRITAGTSISITPQIYFQDAISGEWYAGFASAAITGAAPQYITIEVYPGISEVGANSNGSRTSRVLGRQWGLYVSHNNANAVTYSFSSFALL